MPKTIGEFTHEYRFLSNFYMCDVFYDGDVYPSVEHAYVAAKSLDPEFRAAVRSSKNPGGVKKMGRAVDLRPGWDDMRVSIMRQLVRHKFKDHDLLRRRLLATGDAILVEGNWWHDEFWGVCNGRGENNLGKILMDVREELLILT